MWWFYSEFHKWRQKNWQFKASLIYVCVCVCWEPVSKLKQRVRETAQQVQVLAAKAEKLSSRPRTPGWEEQFLKVAIRPRKPWMNKQKKVSAYSIVYQAADKLRTLWIQSYSHFTCRQWCRGRLDNTFKAHRQSQPRTRGPYGQQLRWTERSWRVPSNDSGVTQQR